MGNLDRFVFDMYDDLNGQVLRSVVPSADELPGFVKTAQHLTGDQIAGMPDDRFALVMFDEGRKLKKYAMADAGNTALSVLYLLKQAHLLPPEAVKVAAQNLLHGCDRFGLDAPIQLKVAAKTGESPISKKSHRWGKSTKIKIDHAKESGGQFVDNPSLGNHEDKNTQENTNYQGIQGTNVVEIPLFPKEKRPNPEQEKKAVAGDPSHWTNEHVQRLQQDYQNEIQAYFNPGAQQRMQRWGDGQGVTPYVDVSGWNPKSVEVLDYAPPEQTLLDGQYPVDSYDQVKQAAVYYADNGLQFHPRQRHEYCTKLAARMTELGMEVPEDIERYGSTTYAADVDSYLQHRRGLSDEHFHPALDILLEKRASIDPEVFVDAVAEFDKMAGLNWFWGGSVVDPWYTVFGPSLEKVAMSDWVWDEQGVRIREDDLENLAVNGKVLLKNSFRDDLVEAFMKNPKTVFESLPRTEKLMLARMASDRFSGTGTE